MRSSLLISAALHVVLVASLLLTAPRRFEPVREQLEVELVADKDAPQPEEKDEKKEEPKPEKQSVWDFPTEKPKFDLPRLEPSEQAKPSAPMQSQAATSAKQKAAPSAPEASVAQQPAQSSAGQQAAATPAPGGAPPPTSSFASEPKPATSIFDPSNIPRLMDLPMGQENGFDAESTVQANLSGDERAAFKAHLRKCWKVPDGLAPATRVVLRVSLRPNGVLATEPVLIEASASRDGPAVLQAAKRALKECQPFAFLPPDKYKEWKVLDLSFTPRDMAGG
jgi:outer membrane biosynthesis protein TonB